MKPTAYAILAALLLSACAAPVYRNASGQITDQRTLQVCQLDAMKSVSGMPLGMAREWIRDDAELACMALNGYRRGPAQ